MTPSPWLALSISVASLLTSTVGWFVVHRLALRRESDNRKRKFIAFLYKWRQEVSRTSEDDRDKLWDDYQKMAILFWGEQSEVKKDFEPEERFDRLAYHLGNFTFKRLTQKRVATQGY